MASTSTWTFLSSFNLFSAFATKPTEQSNEESLKEPLLAKQNQDANASAPTQEAPTVSENNAGTQSTTLYSRLVGMFTSWTKEKEPPAQSAETSSPPPSEAGSSTSSILKVKESPQILTTKLSELSEEGLKSLTKEHSKENEQIPKENEQIPKIKRSNTTSGSNTPTRVKFENNEVRKFLENTGKEDAVVISNKKAPTVFAGFEPSKAKEALPAQVKTTKNEASPPNIPQNRWEDGPYPETQSPLVSLTTQLDELKNVTEQAIGETSKRAQSAVKSLTSFFEKEDMVPPAGPSVAEINSQAPATGPVSSSSSSIRSSGSSSS